MCIIKRFYFKVVYSKTIVQKVVLFKKDLKVNIGDCLIEKKNSQFRRPDGDFNEL